MKTTLLALLALVYALPSASASPGNVKNFKPVLSGVLYRGGGNGGKAPLSRDSLNGLCESGVASAVYAYRTGWTGETSVSCGGKSLRYTYAQWDRPAGADALLKEVYQSIQRGTGSVYVHCWYGVHASGYLAAIALRQFCGLSGEQAVAYWNGHVPPSIRYPKVQKMIRDFQPSPRYEISPEQRAKACVGV